jgi:hypothetical protein
MPDMRSRSTVSILDDRLTRVLLLAIAVAQLLDTLTFLLVVPHAGIEAELNPIARQLYLVYGVFGPLIYRLLTVLAMTCAILMLRRSSRITPMVIGGVIAIGTALLGVSANIATGLRVL